MPDPDRPLFDLFEALRDVIDYGHIMTLVDDRVSLVLRIRSQPRADDPSYPAFLIVVRSIPQFIRIAVRQVGFQAAPETMRHKISSMYDAVKTFKLLAGLVAEERRRVIEYRQAK